MWPMRASTVGDRAHARAADADDVDGARRREVEIGSACVTGRLTAGTGRTSSTRSAKRAVGVGARPSERRGRCAIAREPGRIGEERVELAGEARGRRARRRARSPRRRRARTPPRSRVWWSPGAPGSGTSTDGMPTAASSAVMPPDRHTHQRGVRVERVHVVLVADEPVVEPVAGAARAREPFAALFVAARTGHMVDHHVVAVAPAARRARARRG